MDERPDRRHNIEGPPLDKLMASVFRLGITEPMRSKVVHEFTCDIYDNNGNTALHEASRNGHVDLVTVLANYGATVDSETVRGRTPLFHATYNGQTKAVRELILCGANFNKKLISGLTPLHEASLMNRIPVAMTLLEFGADPRLPSLSGITPIDLAGSPEMERILLTEGKLNKWNRRKIGIWLSSDFNKDSDNLMQKLPADVLHLVILSL